MTEYESPVLHLHEVLGNCVSEEIIEKKDLKHEFLSSNMYYLFFFCGKQVTFMPRLQY